MPNLIALHITFGIAMALVLAVVAYALVNNGQLCRREDILDRIVARCLALESELELPTPRFASLGTSVTNRQRSLVNWLNRRLWAIEDALDIHHYDSITEKRNLHQSDTSWQFWVHCLHSLDRRAASAEEFTGLAKLESIVWINAGVTPHRQTQGPPGLRYPWIRLLPPTAGQRLSRAPDGVTRGPNPVYIERRQRRERERVDARRNRTVA